MNILKSFDAIYRADARILVLGSMPGVASLSANQYYAHPRNAFWSFVSECFGETLPQIYDHRLQMLHRHKLALWDVLQHCVREGSLDANIDPGSEKANDIPALCEELPELRCIVFNGKKAEQSFRKHVLTEQSQLKDGIELIGLPSTSPANASISREKKLNAWKQVFRSYAFD